MSKERLEEIINIGEEAERHFHNNDSFNFATTMEKIYREGHLAWLVERVGMLDHRRKIAYEHSLQETKEKQRYREAIKRALERLNGTVAERYEIAVIYTDLAKTLEELK